jgi:hypothetical protein
MMISDLIGQIGIVGGETVWQDGYIPIAMRNGYWLLLDEFNYINPEISSHFYTVFEERPSLTLKEKPGGEVVKVDPRFRVICTGNAMTGDGDKDGQYVGTQPLNEALKSRFKQIITIKKIKAKQEREIMYRRIPWAPRSIVRNALRIAEELREGPYSNLDTRQIINWIEKIVLDRNYYEAARTTWLPLVKGRDIEDAEKIIKNAGRVVIIGRSTLPPLEKPEAPEAPEAPCAPPTARISRTPDIDLTGLPSLNLGGRKASEINEPESIEAVAKARNRGMSFRAIEKHFNMAMGRGMNAMRVCNKASTEEGTGEENAGNAEPVEASETAQN